MRTRSPRLPHADELFKHSGLFTPKVCQKVYELDVSSIPHPVRSRRSIEAFLQGSGGFRGRSLLPPTAAGAQGGEGEGGNASPPGTAASALPAPPAEGVVLQLPSPAGAAGGQAGVVYEHWEDGEVLEGREGADEAASASQLALGQQDPVVVSILLPANASQGENGGSGQLTAVDKVFVVMLHPQEKYVTYSCALPRPILM
jgi:hypothetical protein